MNRNISLVGFMGTGKSAIGRNIAKELGYDFVDTDRHIECEMGKSISEIFSELGEKEFRKIESKYLKDLLNNEKKVIATGGGIVLLKENRMLLKEKTFVVSLKAKPKTIYYRIKRNKKRPLLNTQKPYKKINQLLRQRKGLYDFGDITVVTDYNTIEALAKNITNYYKSYIAKHS